MHQHFAVPVFIQPCVIENSIALAITFKQKILYMYVCSILCILIFNVVLGKFISYLNKHTKDDFK